jgi:hypothetical protein
VTLNDNFFDARRAEQKGALYADPVAGYAANGEIGVVSAVANANHSAFELLNSLSVSFFDEGVDAYDVTGAQFRDIFINGCFKRFQYIAHLFFLNGTILLTQADIISRLREGVKEIFTSG